MAASAAILGFGTTFSIGNGASPEVFTALGEVTYVKPPSVAIQTVDVTHNTSPSGVREFIAGLQDNGEIEVGLNYIPSVTSLAAAVVIRGLYQTKQNVRITYPNTKTDTFKAILTSFTSDAPLDGKVSAVLKFKVSGVITAA
jgi:predicted secreted protein